MFLWVQPRILQSPDYEISLPRATAPPADIFVCMFLHVLVLMTDELNNVEKEFDDGGVILKSRVFQIIKCVEDFDVFKVLARAHESMFVTVVLPNFSYSN